MTIKDLDLLVAPLKKMGVSTVSLAIPEDAVLDFEKSLDKEGYAGCCEVMRANNYFYGVKYMGIYFNFLKV